MSLRPTRIEVNLEPLAFNFSSISDFLKPWVQPHGSRKSQRLRPGCRAGSQGLQEAGCQRFAVATPDEAVELRENGLSEPILVLGPSPRDAARTICSHGHQRGMHRPVLCRGHEQGRFGPGEDRSPSSEGRYGHGKDRLFFRKMFRKRWRRSSIFRYRSGGNIFLSLQPVPTRGNPELYPHPVREVR